MSETYFDRRSLTKMVLVSLGFVGSGLLRQKQRVISIFATVSGGSFRNSVRKCLTLSVTVSPYGNTP